MTAAIAHSGRSEQHQNRTKSVAAAIDLGREVLEAFLTPTSASSLPAGLIDNLVKKIETFPRGTEHTVSKYAQELDQLGTALWNQCTRLRRKFQVSDLSPKATLMNILLARIYALLLLDCAQPSAQATFANSIRLLKLALKVVKNCIELKQYDLTTIALEKAGCYDEYLQRSESNQSEEDQSDRQRLNGECFALRISLACKQEKFEIAEHLFSKVKAGQQYLNAESAESIADVFYELAKRQITREQNVTAVTWLDRALDLLMTQERDQLSHDANELRISIMQSSVTALLRCGDLQAMEQAARVIDILESEIGSKLVVLLLKLERLQSPVNEVFDGEAYALVLHRMIQTIPLNDKTFKTIMHHTRKLNDKSPSLACKILDELILTRLQDDEHKDRLENVIINRLWMTSNQNDTAELVQSIQYLLDMLRSTLGTPLSASGTHASQILLWKRVEQNYACGTYDVAERWCRLALHPVFESSSGDLNKAKIARRLLMCALARLDNDGAYQAVAMMSEQAKAETLTQFLIFKLAIRTEDLDLAQQCLANVDKDSNESSGLLYACVLDAQKAGCKKLTVAALQLVLSKSREEASTQVHQPALLRCIIRIIVSTLETEQPNESGEMDASAEQICGLFNLAASQVTKSRRASGAKDNPYDQRELDWFSKNSYNVALKYSAIWDSHWVYKLISASIIFCESFPIELDLRERSDLQLRRVFSEYLAAILLATSARKQDHIESQLQDYLALRKHVANFENKSAEMSEIWEAPLNEDLNKKLCGLLAFDFEAAVRLRDWDALSSITLKAEKCSNIWVLEVFADCLLSEEVPSETTIVRLKAIVNSAWSIGGMDIPRFSRYIRLLFQTALLHQEATAVELLGSIEQHIIDAAQTEQPYPYEEIEWIATTAFNHAVDFYCTEEDAKCKQWASRAISIASHLKDGHALRDILVEKLAGLSFNDV